MKARRTRIKLIYQGADISRDVAPDLLSFEYTDNESGKVDDIAIKLKNDHELWSGPWFPGKGDTMQATIIDEDFGDLYCGTFSVDDLSYAGPPKTFDIKGVSIPINRSVRRQKKSKAWEDATLKQIAEDIADIGGVNLVYDVEQDPRYDRIDQREESDLEFLHRITSGEGFSLKVTDNQIVVFSQAKYESQGPVTTIELGKSDISSFSFQSQAFDLYSKCTVSYMDPVTEELIEQTFTDPNITDGITFKVLKRASSFAEAQRWAKAELRRRNKHEIKGDIQIIGSIDLVSGIVIAIKNFGKFDGNYFVETAKHTVANGYKTALTLRKVIGGY